MPAAALQGVVAYVDFDLNGLTLIALGLVTLVALALRRWWLALGVVVGGAGVPVTLLALVLSNPHSLESVH